MSRLIVVVPLMFALVPFALAGDVALEAHVLSYAHDLEFFQESFFHQEGRTYFGQLAAVFGTVSPAPGVVVGAGLLIDIEFGRDLEENRDATEPYLFLETELGSGVLRFGNLDRRRQDLHHALIAPELRYDRPADRGLAFRRDGERTTVKSWIQWRLQEREDRRELFDVGGTVRWRPAEAGGAVPVIEAEMHIVHVGGQMSAVGRLEESWGLLAGPVWSVDLGDGGWAAELAARAGATADRRFRHDGRGAEARLALLRGGFQAWITQWWGDEWSTMDGRPLYRYGDVTSWGVRHRWRPGGWIDADLGVRIHALGGDKESEFWLLMDLASLGRD